VRVVLILLVLLLLRLRVLRGAHAFTHNASLEGIGLALFALGLGLAVWARIYLGRNWGMPMTRKDEPELVTSGPYRKVRHPIYSGIILAMVGTAVGVSLYWLVAVAILGGYFLYSAVIEERNMVSTFPDSYPEYKSSTKMLIPYVL
jgi:protein-S-isoprenylcysteine O-methyltransferase Ste14